MDGTIYEQSLKFYDDAGASIRRVRRAPHVWDKNRMVTVDRFEVSAQTGMAKLEGQGSRPLLMLRYSVDGGHTWYGAALDATGDLD